MAGISKLMPAALGYDLGEVVVCVCSFGTNGTSDPASSGFRGDILSTVAYAATGVYTVTLRDMGYEILGAFCDLQLATATGDYEAQAGATDTSALTQVIQIRKSSDATAVAPPASNANNRVNLVLFLRRKSVARRRS